MPTNQSEQARQRHRNIDGTFAKELDDIGFPGSDTLSKYEQKRLQEKKGNDPIPHPHRRHNAHITARRLGRTTSQPQWSHQRLREFLKHHKAIQRAGWQ